MVLLEAAHVTIAALATGLVLGVVYGWAGAQSLLGSVPVRRDSRAHRALRLAGRAVLAGRRDRGRDHGADPGRRGRADAPGDPRGAGRGARRVTDGCRGEGFRRGIRHRACSGRASGGLGLGVEFRVVRPRRRHRRDARRAPLPRRPQHRPQGERGRAADRRADRATGSWSGRRERARSPSGGPRRPGSRAVRSAGCRCRGRSAPARSSPASVRSLKWISCRPIGTMPASASCTGTSPPGSHVVGRPSGSSGDRSIIGP